MTESAASPPQVKICGITRPVDAEMAEEAGAAYVGVVLVPGSPRTSSPERAREIGRAVSLPLVIVVPAGDPNEAADWAERAEAQAIQLHGAVSPEGAEALRPRGPWELWAALRVRTRRDIEAGLGSWTGLADLLLLDAWHPSGQGGTGTRFPWDALDEVRPQWPRGLRLGAAGGLTPANVEVAVTRMRPHLVDVSSGVEAAPGVKDRDAVRAFVTRAQAARATPRSPEGGE